MSFEKSDVEKNIEDKIGSLELSDGTVSVTFEGDGKYRVEMDNQTLPGGMLTGNTEIWFDGDEDDAEDLMSFIRTQHMSGVYDSASIYEMIKDRSVGNNSEGESNKEEKKEKEKEGILGTFDVGGVDVVVHNESGEGFVISFNPEKMPGDIGSTYIKISESREEAEKVMNFSKSMSEFEDDPVKVLKATQLMVSSLKL